jgi:5'(3')-deoxyribonucleotidase
MEKINLFLDFDETLTQSIKQFVKVANKRFGTNKNYEELKKWNFEDLFPNITYENINDIFASDDFFVDLELIEDVETVMNKLKEQFNIYIATIGSEDNLRKKESWLKDNLKDIKYKFIGLLDNSSSIEYDKSSVDMTDSIFVDDRVDNLRSSNAKVKILFKNNKNYDWQQIDSNEEIYIVNSWKEIYDMLSFFAEHREFI